MPPATAPDCLELVIEKEELAQTYRRALSAMAPVEQQVLLRRMCRGQPFTAIACALGVSLRDARLAFTRAHLQLHTGQREPACENGHQSDPTLPRDERRAPTRIRTGPAPAGATWHGPHSQPGAQPSPAA